MTDDDLIDSPDLPEDLSKVRIPDIVRAAVKKESASAVIEMPAKAPAAEAGFGAANRGARRGERRGPGGRGNNERRGGAPEEEESNLEERVVHINRCAKVVKGGRRFSFSALVVVGDKEGNVGVGYGKAKEVPDCIRKGTEQARKNMAPIQLKGNTIPHAVTGEHDGGQVLLRPASPGTGVIAGGGVRAVLECCGVKDVLSKSLRSNNPGAVVFATLDALTQLRRAETIRNLRQG